ncbi:hypothetical protein LZ31DRAFT_217211 [Colletotrichum somersetense]|nr:hypothetical protein LZ31DRAFT_217211 [Colletotrichum somersetense]
MAFLFPDRRRGTGGTVCPLRLVASASGVAGRSKEQTDTETRSWNDEARLRSHVGFPVPGLQRGQGCFGVFAREEEEKCRGVPTIYPVGRDTAETRQVFGWVRHGSCVTVDTGRTDELG